MAARTPVLWLLEVLLVNLSAGFYFVAFRRFLFFSGSEESLVWALALLNTAMLAAWEAGILFGLSWMDDRWSRRVIAALAGTGVTFLAVWGIFESSSVGALAIPFYFAWLAGVYFYYRYRARDLFVLAGSVLSLIVFVACFLGNALLKQGDAGAFFIIGLIVIGMSAAGAWWLRGLAAEDDKDANA
jgi:hypothetical protein